MKICIAQSKSIPGDIEGNILMHKKFIKVAISEAADIIVFPELSLTGYEPKLARDLATESNNPKFDDFQLLADSNNIVIGVGMPTKAFDGICISMIVFQPKQDRQIYSKSYLHPDENEFFVPGSNSIPLTVKNVKVALAICYEISIREHSINAHKTKATVYLASVAKTLHGSKHAIKSLAEIAVNYSMIVMMSNCVGQTSNFECGGKSSIWDRQGILIGQLDDQHEGALFYESETRKCTRMQI